MSVSNGQVANQDTFNNAFASKQDDNILEGNQEIQGTVNLTNGGSATITDLQSTINTISSEDADIRTTQGTSTGDTDLGTFAGATISDSATVKQALGELETAVELKEDAANKGNPGGYPSLDGTGRIPSSQLPTTASEYLGAWNASTNSPSLADGSGTNGDFYRVSVAGTQDLGSGSDDYSIGDVIIYNGSIWEKIPADDQVQSVNGQTGIVSLDIDDVTPTTTKGDLIVENGTNAVRIAIGTDDQVLTADSTTTEGVAWKDASGSVFGDFLTATSSDFPFATAGFNNNDWAQMTGNSVSLAANSTYLISGAMTYDRGGSDASLFLLQWSTANGANNTTTPAAATLDSGIVSYRFQDDVGSSSFADHDFVTMTSRITTTAAIDLFLNVNASFISSSTGLVRVNILAQRIL